MRPPPPNSMPGFAETGALPQFRLDELADADKTTQWTNRSFTIDDLELIEDEPAAPASVAPVALDASDLEDVAVEEEPSVGDVQTDRRRVPWLPITVAAGMLLGLAGIVSLARPERRFLSAASIEPPPVAAAPKEPVPPPVAAPPVAPAPPAKAATTGTIVTPLWAKGRRVWIDGKVIAGHAPKVEAACGPHTVKIGAYSKTKKVDIPCGGEIKLTP